MGKAVVTLRYRARTTPAGYRQLEQALLDLGLLYNAVVVQRGAATSTHRGQYSRRRTGRDITELRQDEPYCGYAHRLLTGVEQQVNDAFTAHYDSRKDGHKGPKRGRPDTKDPHRRRTITLSEPAVNHLEVRANEQPQLHLWHSTEPPSKNGDRAAVRIKGLPTLRLRADERLPRDRQPKSISITLDAGRLTVGLAYELGKDWPEPEHESAGADPGKTHTLTISGSDGRTRYYHRPDEREYDRRTRCLRRKLQRQRDAALADGRAGWTSRRNRSGQVRRRFRWNGAPAHSYLKTLRQLQAVERRRSGQRRDWSHRVSAELVQRYAIICWEDTRILNLTKSARGTVEEPGRNVAQKRGLNRAILAQGWGQLRSFTEYKGSWASRIFVAVPARNTSITCPECGEINAKSRPTRDLFRCANCGYTGEADGNAAEIIRRQGLRLLGRADVRLASKEDETPVRAAEDPGHARVKRVTGAEGLVPSARPRPQDLEANLIGEFRNRLKETPEHRKFILNATPEDADRVQALLQREGIAFEATEALVEFDPSYDGDYWVMEGKELEHLLKKVNEHLHDNHPGLSVPNPVGTRQCAEALHLSYWGFEWHGGRVDEDLWNNAGRTWDEVKREHPALFGPEGK